MSLRKWMKRLLILAAIGVVGTALYSTIEPLQREVSAARVAERLTAVFRRPVAVADTEFRFTPSPRMVVRGIQTGTIKVDEASLLINWKDLWSALRGGQWVWGEATIAPMSVTAAQAAEIATSLPAGASALSTKISTIRFESVRVSDTELLSGRYEAVIRRGDDGRFGPLVVRELESDGTMRLALRPAQTSDGRPVLDFRLDADRWALPFGPRVKWNEVRANGRVDGNLIEVSSYSLAGFYGVVSGMMYAASDVEWVITGRAIGTNIDLESVVQHLRKAPAGLEPILSPVQGTAALNLTVVGRGTTLDEAVRQAVFAGPFQLRWAALNGINLGLAATQGATAGGGDPLYRVRRSAGRVVGRGPIRGDRRTRRRAGGTRRLHRRPRPGRRRYGPGGTGGIAHPVHHAARARQCPGAAFRPVVFRAFPKCSRGRFT